MSHHLEGPYRGEMVAAVCAAASFGPDDEDSTVGIPAPEDGPPTPAHKPRKSRGSFASHVTPEHVKDLKERHINPGMMKLHDVPEEGGEEGGGSGGGGAGGSEAKLVAKQDGAGEGTTEAG